ncbi:hypothetical protein, partial [Rhodoferax sp.]|uniref:hypothetical protein n=1 Tax=Rhodoferax sp. TaxID=50421 RepID=UPI003BB605D0
MAKTQPFFCKLWVVPLQSPGTGFNVKEHACHAGLDPASMNSEPWIADQVRNDNLLSCFWVAGRPCKLVALSGKTKYGSQSFHCRSRGGRYRAGGWLQSRPQWPTAIKDAGGSA